MKNIIILIMMGLILAASYFIGVSSNKKSKGSASSFIGSAKSFGPIVVALSTTSAIASGWMLVGVPAVVYTDGNIMAMNTLAAAGFALAYIFIGKKVRGIAEAKEISTIGDLVDARFNNNRIIKFCTSTVLFIGCFSYLAAQIGAGASLLAYLFGWDTFISAVLIFSVVILYVAVGGESAGILSQAFQGAIMFIAGLIIIAIFFYYGGFKVMTEGVINNPTVTGGGVTSVFEILDFTAFGTQSQGGAMAFYIFGILGMVCQPATVSRMYAIKNPRELPNLSFQIGIIQGVVSFFGFVIGYLAVLFVTNGMMSPIADPGQTSWVIGEHLGFGVQLLLYAAIVAAIISSASTYLSLGASSFSVDILGSLGVKQNDKQKIKTFQFMIVVIGIIAILMASFGGGAVAALGVLGWATFMTIIIPVVIIGFLWKKANVKGITAAAVVSLVGNVGGLIAENFTTISMPQGIPWTVYLIAITTFIAVIVSYVTYDAEKDITEEIVIAALEL